MIKIFFIVGSRVKHKVPEESSFKYALVVRTFHDSGPDLALLVLGKTSTTNCPYTVSQESITRSEQGPHTKQYAKAFSRTGLFLDIYIFNSALFLAEMKAPLRL